MPTEQNSFIVLEKADILRPYGSSQILVRLLAAGNQTVLE